MAILANFMLPRQGVKTAVLKNKTARTGSKNDIQVL
jgi:hypothetical protein